MAIGKKPSLTPKAVNLETPEVQNFINSGFTTAQTKEQKEIKDKDTKEEVKEIKTETKEEVKRGRKSTIDAVKVKYYNLPIPEEIFESIEDYIYINRRKKKVTIRAFIIECIKEKLEKENIL